MHVVYDPSHVLHDPTTEVQYGVAMPMYEVPGAGRLDPRRVADRRQLQLRRPGRHGLEPVLAVHHEGLTCGPSVLGVPEVPAPFAAALESGLLPGRGRITNYVLRLLGQPAGDDVQPVAAAASSGRPRLAA